MLIGTMLGRYEIQAKRGEGGMVAFESADGYVYSCGHYAQKRGIGRVPVAGGREPLELDRRIVPSQWYLTDDGVYFTGPPATVSFFDFDTRSVTNLGPALSDSRFGMFTDGIGMTPDGKSLFFIAGPRQSRNIMMIDNLR